MKITVVSSDRLTSHDLRAEAYVYHFATQAKKILRSWREKVDPSMLLNIRGTAWQALEETVTEELKQAYAAGYRGD